MKNKFKLRLRREREPSSTTTGRRRVCDGCHRPISYVAAKCGSGHNLCRECSHHKCKECLRPPAWVPGYHHQ